MGQLRVLACLLAGVALATAPAGAQTVDFLFNYLSPIILPPGVLGALRRASVNFHPAPPEWPGVGSASYALYAGDAAFGATAHLMTEKPDAGAILRVRRFPVAPDDTCERLFDRALAETLVLFKELLPEIARTGQPVPNGEAWARKAITRAQFERWMTLPPDAPPEEVRRKVRALRHSRFPGPFVELAGVRFALPPDPKLRRP